MEQTPTIHLRDVSVIRKNKRTNQIILNDVNIEIYPYDLVYFIGKIGSGKSSLFKALYSELPIYGSTASIVGYDLLNMKNRYIPFLRRNIGIVFQDFQLLDDRNVYQNLKFVLLSTNWSNENAIHTRIMKVLSMVGLDNKAGRMPYMLSGGEQQCLAIARALLNEPKVILADEPTGSLDYESYERIMNLFFDIAATGCSVVIATHNISILENFPSRTIRFAENKAQEIDIKSILGLEDYDTYEQEYEDTCIEEEYYEQEL